MPQELRLCRSVKEHNIEVFPHLVDLSHLPSQLVYYFSAAACTRRTRYEGGRQDPGLSRIPFVRVDLILRLCNTGTGPCAARKGLDCSACRPVKKSVGATTSLSAYVGQKPCVVFFYPKAGTTVCTKEACKACVSALNLLRLPSRRTLLHTPLLSAAVLTACCYLPSTAYTAHRHHTSVEQGISSSLSGCCRCS